MDDDPLALKQLAVKFDYLVYKINDQVTTLAEQTYSAVQQKQRLIDDYLHQLHLDQHLEDADELLRRCDDLERDLIKLNQLYVFVNEFKGRISGLEKSFGH